MWGGHSCPPLSILALTWILGLIWIFWGYFGNQVELYAFTTLPLRMQPVQARIFLPWPSTLAFTGRKLTFQRRLVMLLAWLTLFPNCGPLPQISQTRAITKTFQLLWIRSSE